MGEIAEMIGPSAAAALGWKAAEPPAVAAADSSVQVRTDMHTRTRLMVWQIAQAYDEAPAWWSERRDRYLRQFWPTEPFLAGAVYAVCARNAALRWKLTGPDRAVKKAHNLLTQSQFGQGDEALRLLLSQDLLTQDNAAFMEVIRPARALTSKGWRPLLRWPDAQNEPAWWVVDGELRPLAESEKAVSLPTDLPIGLAHLDAGRCVRTGDDEFPVIYTDRLGREHKLAWYQVVMFSDMPSTDEDYNGVGICAVSRALRLAQTLRDQQIYKAEKVSGRFSRAIHLTNVSAQAVNDAIAEANNAADAHGLQRYSQPIVVDTLDPSSTPAVATIELAALPDGFDEETALRWYVAGLALDLGVDYSFLAPLPGGNLGTATQVETMDKQARGRSSRLFMARFAHALNNMGILPQSVAFEFVETDADEELVEAQLAHQRAETRALRIETGEITVEVARQMAADAGDLDERYLALLGSEDATPTGTVEGEDSPQAEQAQAEATPKVAPEPAEADGVDEADEDAEDEATKQAADPVIPTGAPLPPLDEPQEITPADVARAIVDFQQHAPELYRDLLTAPEAS